MAKIIERELPCSESKLKIFGNRLRQKLTGEIVQPYTYVVEKQQDLDLYYAYEHDALYRGRGGGYPFDLSSQRIQVQAHGNAVFNRNVYSNLLSMYIFRGTIHGQQSVWLFEDEIISWVHIGHNTYKLYYKQVEDSVVQLAGVVPQEHFYGTSYQEGKAFTQEQAMALNLPSKGFPLRYNWIKTAQMYSRLQVPNEKGEFSPDSPPLTALDIYRRPVIGV